MIFWSYGSESIFHQQWLYNAKNTFFYAWQATFHTCKIGVQHTSASVHMRSNFIIRHSLPSTELALTRKKYISYTFETTYDNPFSNPLLTPSSYFVRDKNILPSIYPKRSIIAWRRLLNAGGTSKDFHLVNVLASSLSQDNAPTPSKSSREIFWGVESC